MFSIFDKEYQLTLMLEEARQEGWTEGWKEGWVKGWAEGQVTSIRNIMSTLKLTA